MNFEDFISVFFTMDYFLILLIVLLLIVLVITLYLIKGQYVNKKATVEDNDTLDNVLINLINQEKPEEKKAIPEEIKSTLEENINYYEKDEEECAIISNEELEKISRVRSINTNNDLIIQYETEQEKKAIISYEELLKNASNLKMSYEETPISASGPLIRKVDIETPTIDRSLNYMEEANFLSKLKEFRSNLK